MRLITILLALGATIVAAAPAQESSDVIPRGIKDCTWCIDIYDFCAKNGHTKGQEGCLQTCRENICHRNPECKGCGTPFDLCPEKSRFHH